MNRRRTLIRAGLAALPTAVLAGCFGGASDSPLTWWELEASASGGSAVADPRRARQSVVVEGIAAGALYDGTSLLYSRAPGVRASYQFASWTERPAARIARLAKRRLQARGGFRDVSTAEAGVAPDLLLTLLLERLYHDVSVQPGLLQLQVTATLTDWHRRRPIASHHFTVQEPVQGADAGSAAAAAGRAVGVLLDELAPWVEASALDGERTPRGRPGDAGEFAAPHHTAPDSQAGAGMSGGAGADPHRRPGATDGGTPGQPADRKPLQMDVRPTAGKRPARRPQ